MTDASHSIDVLAVDELPRGEQREVEAAGHRILLCHTGEGIFAVQAQCSHARKPLVGGKVKGCVINCPHHGARFDLRDGAVRGAPAVLALKTWPVEVSGDRICVRIDG